MVLTVYLLFGSIVPLELDHHVLDCMTYRMLVSQRIVRVFLSDVYLISIAHVYIIQRDNSAFFADCVETCLEYTASGCFSTTLHAAKTNHDHLSIEILAHKCDRSDVLLLSRLTSATDEEFAAPKRYFSRQ
ncbi:unnamed protein product [Albugo candida]|uniref:Uncharacterized protein n=1 Tax=Albugo candida TaxID=65357 RepID=A0A024G0V1_9STRA|nr:unnamed protein product [Albugo candida]|eukprot:CCI39925.1 unnamed protein product [Albugo candida]